MITGIVRVARCFSWKILRWEVFWQSMLLVAGEGTYMYHLIGQTMPTWEWTTDEKSSQLSKLAMITIHISNLHCLLPRWLPPWKLTYWSAENGSLLQMIHFSFKMVPFQGDEPFIFRGFGHGWSLAGQVRTPAPTQMQSGDPKGKNGRAHRRIFTYILWVKTPKSSICS